MVPPFVAQLTFTCVSRANAMSEFYCATTSRQHTQLNMQSISSPLSIAHRSLFVVLLDNTVCLLVRHAKGGVGVALFTLYTFWATWATCEKVAPLHVVPLSAEHLVLYVANGYIPAGGGACWNLASICTMCWRWANRLCLVCVRVRVRVCVLLVVSFCSSLLFLTLKVPNFVLRTSKERHKMPNLLNYFAESVANRSPFWSSAFFPLWFCTSVTSQIIGACI